jgi:hypothetical protein
MHLRTSFLEENALLNVPRDTNITHVAHIQMNAAQTTAEVGTTHLHGTSYGGVPPFTFYRLTAGVQLKVAADPFGRRGGRPNRSCPLDLHVLVALWAHALGKYYALRAIALFLATWLEARPPERPQGPAILLHEIGITLLAVEV